jgi:urea transport system permease protein
VALPDVWPFFLGALFVLVTLFLPDGLAGLFDRRKREPSGPPSDRSALSEES